MNACCCDTIGAPLVVRPCRVHHIYHFGDRELTSVTQCIKSTWPIPPDYSKADPAVLENARERGVEVDALLTSWLAGELPEIPAGVREDTRDLFVKLTDWWTIEDNPRSQVILANDELAGTADIITDNAVYDLKTTYNLEPTYSLQVGGYVCLYEAEHGRLPERCGIIHLTKRQKPKLIEFEPLVVAGEFRVVYDMYKLVNRIAGKRRSDA